MKIKTPHGEIVVKDVIADAFLQQILLRPAEYDVIATMNLNGDYISDALAAQVGGIGIAPGRQHVGFCGDVRSDARHCAEVRRQGLRQSRFGDPLGRDDAAAHGLDRGGGPVISSMEKRSWQEGHLRLRAPDGRRDPGLAARASGR